MAYEKHELLTPMLHFTAAWFLVTHLCTVLIRKVRKAHHRALVKSAVTEVIVTRKLHTSEDTWVMIKT